MDKTLNNSLRKMCQKMGFFRFLPRKSITTQIMSEDGFYLARILSYKNRIVGSVLIRKHAGDRKSVFWHILHWDYLGSSKAVANLFQSHRKIKKRFLLFKVEVAIERHINRKFS